MKKTGNRSTFTYKWTTNYRLARLIATSGLSLLIVACTPGYNPLDEFREIAPATITSTPDIRLDPQGDYTAEQIAQGRYLVELIGCGACHTDGALVGTPNPNLYLAGSKTGIAYSNPLQQKNPGVVYPANLSSDPETGIAKWSDQEIIRVIRSGEDRYGRRHIPVMPWPAYQKISDQDAQAIVAYLRALPPINHEVPENVKPGDKASYPFVYFSIYQSLK